MKRLLILIACCLLLCTAVMAQEPVITNLKTDCVVSAAGDCKVTQTFNLQMDEPQTELTFPLGTNVKDASVLGYRAGKVTVNKTECLILKNKAGFTGNRSFTVTYTLKNLVTTANGVQTLTLPMLCAEWPWEIQAYDFTIMMPSDFMASPVFESGYVGDVIADHMDITMKSESISGSLQHSLRDHESMTMRMDLEDGYFSGAHETWKGGGASVILVSLCVILGLLVWFFMLRSPKLSYASRALPPDSSQPGDLPYLLCGKKPHFAATILYWASLGYLTIRQDEEGHVTLVKNMDMGNERRKYECKLFEMLFSEGDEVDSSQLIIKRTAEKAANAIPRFWNKRLYVKNSGNPLILKALSYLATAIAMLSAMGAWLPDFGVRGLVLFLSFFAGGAIGWLAEKILPHTFMNDKFGVGVSGVAILVLIGIGRLSNTFGVMLLAIGLLLFSSWQTLHGGKRTDYGTQMISQTLGFHRYLRKLSEKRMKTQQAQDPQYFYKLLPYAVAVNQGESFVLSTGEMDLEPCDWFTDPHQMRTAGEFFAKLQDAISSLELSVDK